MLYPRETDHFSNDAKAVPLGVGSVSFLPDSTLSSLSVPIWILGAWHIVGAASVPQRVNAWMCILCRCAQESQFPPKCIPGKNRNLHKHFWFLNGGFLMLLKEISPTSAASPPRVHLSHWNLLLLALSGVRGSTGAAPEAGTLCQVFVAPTEAAVLAGTQKVLIKQWYHSFRKGRLPLSTLGP